MKLIKTIKEKITFWIMKRKADHLHSIDGKQYFIVPVVTRGKVSMQLMNNQLHGDYNRRAKKMGYRTLRYDDLLKMALYKTKQGSLTR